MKISAKISSQKNLHQVTVLTGENVKSLDIKSGKEGYGSEINGGEFLFLAIATCFCNDIYREARKKKIEITHITVEASGEFDQEGEPGYNISYQAKLQGNATDADLEELILETDKVSEIHNTLRKGVAVNLVVSP